MKRIDRFHIVKRLGEAGPAVLYKAQEQLAPDFWRNVLLKVYAPAARDAPDPAMLRELRTLLAVDGHPFIIDLYAAGQSEAGSWLAEEWPETTLESRIGEQGGEPEETRRLLHDIGAALGALHTLEPPALHNEVHPGSIVIAPGGFYKLGGFAAAARTTEESTLPATMAPYAAPELLTGELGPPGPPADLYALGHVAYLLALGLKNHRRQFAGVFDERTGGRDAPPGKWLAWHCSLNTPLAPVHEVRKGFPQWLSKVIARLTAKNLEARYRSAAEMLDDLAAGAGAAQVSAAQPAAPLPPASPLKRGILSASAAPLRPEGRTPVSPAPATPASGIPSPPQVAPAVPASAGQPHPAGKTLYYVRLRDRRSGPFDWATLVKQARMGLISRLHQISTDQVNWKPAGTIQGLFEERGA